MDMDEIDKWLFSVASQLVAKLLSIFSEGRFSFSKCTSASLRSNAFDVQARDFQKGSECTPWQFGLDLMNVLQ